MNTYKQFDQLFFYVSKCRSSIVNQVKEGDEWSTFDIVNSFLLKQIGT